MMVLLLLRASVVLLASSSLVQAATYAIPRVRSVQTKSGVPVMIAAFVSCKITAPTRGQRLYNMAR